MDTQLLVPLLIRKLQILLHDNTTNIDPTPLETAINQLQSFLPSLKLAHYCESFGLPMKDDWMSKLLNTVYSADDAVNLFLRRTNMQQTQRQRTRSSCLIVPCTPFRSFQPPSQPQIMIAKAMTNLTTDIQRLSTDLAFSQQFVDLDIPGSSGSMNELRMHSQQQTQTPYLEENWDVSGLEKQVDKLVDFLSNPEGRVIVLVGQGGSGKTTLARVVYNRPDIKTIFPTRSWVCISKDSKVRDLMACALKQIQDPVLEEPILESGIQQNILRIYNPPINSLLVIDDEFGKPEVMEKVQACLEKFGNIYNKVIITTRVSDEERIARIGHHCCVKLDPKDSWALFLKKVRDVSKDELKRNSMKDKILKLCNGVPLAVALMGSLLSTKELSSETWSRVLEQATSSTDVLAPVAVLSCMDLPSNIKPCFLYMGLFPRGFEIPIRRVLRLWSAEGFLSRLDAEADDPEDLAEDYFQQLVLRNMIEITRWRIDGSPKTCRMPTALHDIFAQKAKDIGFFHILPKSYNMSAEKPKVAVRRLVACSGIKKYPSLELYIQHLHTYISFNAGKRGTPIARELDIFLNKAKSKKDNFTLLKVLDLEGVYKPVLPEALGEMFPFLTYLGLRSTALDSVSASVGELTLLETLDVKHTFITNLPGSICEAKNLRHLYMNWIDLHISNVESCSEFMSKIQTLWGLSISNNSKWSEKLMGIRRLGVKCLSKDAQEAMVDLISRQTKLQSLLLRSNSADEELSLNSLVEHQELRELYLVGRLHPIEVRDDKLFPSNLKILTLSLSKLEDDPMPKLGQLKNLKILMLLRHSYLGKRMTCESNGFPQLHVLKLWNLATLEEWIMEEGSLACLRQVEVRECSYLHPPTGLGRLTTLNEFILTNCGGNMRMEWESMFDNIKNDKRIRFEWRYVESIHLEHAEI